MKLSINQKVTKEKVKKKWLILDDDPWKIKWDIFVFVMLIFTAFVVPLRLAFSETDDVFWTIINVFIDLTFLVDVILSFFTTYFDEKTATRVTDKKMIAKTYLKTWFFIDVISILPLDLFFSQS